MFVGYALLHVGLAFYYGHAAEKVDGVSMTKTVDGFENLRWRGFHKPIG